MDETDPNSEDALADEGVNDSVLGAGGCAVPMKI